METDFKEASTTCRTRKPFWPLVLVRLDNASKLLICVTKEVHIRVAYI